MIVFLRSIDCHPDPRLQKYIDYLSECEIDSHVICWDRTGQFVDDKTHTYYQRIAGFGDGIKNYKGLLGFNWFIVKRLYEYRKKYKVIHACDFDTVLPALLFKLFFRKKVIFDVFDWYSESRVINNRVLRWLIERLESIAVRYSDKIIICEPERITQLGDVYDEKVIIMQNIPDFPESFSKHNGMLACDNRLRIGYVGILSRYRGLEELLESVSARPSSVTLSIAGFGELEDFATDYAERYANITFLGKVTYDEGLKLLAESDCIYAMYYKIIPNHIMAAPNKFYESLFLSRPIITTGGTAVGDKVLKYDCGFVIEEGIDALNELLDSISEKMIEEKGDNASKCWQLFFKNRIAEFFTKDYFPFISKYATRN